MDHDDVAGQRGQDEPAAPDAAAGGEREADGDEQRAGVEDKAREQRDHDLRPRSGSASNASMPRRRVSRGAEAGAQAVAALKAEGAL